MTELNRAEQKRLFLLANPPRGGVDDPKPAPAGAPPASPPASGGPPTAPPSGGFQLPAELTGKSAQEIGQYYNDRYKDYDSYKGRAEIADRFGTLKASPEEVENTRRWISGVLGGLRGGKRAVLNTETNQIEFVDGEGKVTQAPTETQDIFADWDTIDGRTQAQRLDQRVQTTINGKAQELVQRYDKEIREAMQRIEAKSNLFIDILERCMDNPSIKPREMLAKLNEYGQNGNSLDLATRELTAPAQTKAQIDAAVAAGIADFKNKWEQEHAAPLMGTPSGMRPRPHATLDANGKPASMAEVRKQVIQGWREKGLTQ